MLQRFCFSPWTLLQLPDTAITHQGIATVPRSVLDFRMVIRTIPITATIGLSMATAGTVMGTTITGITITDRTMGTGATIDTTIDTTARAIGDLYKSNIFHATQVTDHTVDIDIISPQSHGVHAKNFRFQMISDYSFQIEMCQSELPFY